MSSAERFVWEGTLLFFPLQFKQQPLLAWQPGLLKVKQQALLPLFLDWTQAAKEVCFLNLTINGSIFTECYGVLFEGSVCPLYVDMAALKTEMVFLSFLLNSSYSFVYGKSQQHHSSVSRAVWLVLYQTDIFTSLTKHLLIRSNVEDTWTSNQLYLTGLSFVSLH